MNIFPSIAQDKSPFNLKKEDFKKVYNYTSYPQDPTKTRIYSLDNGLTVFLSPNDKEPRININVAVKAGSKNDPSTHTGLAHYLEHLLFKGTDRFGTKDFEKERVHLEKIETLYEKHGQEKDDAERKKIYKEIDSTATLAAEFAVPNEISKMFSSIGAKGTNAFTSFDMTVYVNDIPSNQLENWAKIEAERYRNPQLRLFHTELETVYEEKNRAMDNESRQVMEGMMSGLFENHNYGLQTTLGTVEHLKNPSITQIKNFFYKHYVPNNMALVLSGDFNPDDAIRILDTHFGKMEPKEVQPYRYIPENVKSKPTTKEVYGPNAESVLLAWRMPGSTSPENDLYEFMALLLDNDKAGILDLNITKKQKTLRASAFTWTFKDYGVFIIEADPKENQTLEECQKLLLETIDMLKKGDFEESLLQAVIDNLEVKETRVLENNQGRTSSLQRAFVYDNNWGDYLDRFQRMRKYTKKDVIAFANKYLIQDYVIINKRQGKAPETSKINKPEITALKINRNDESEFAKDIYANSVNTLEPVFIDFKKDIVFSKTKQNDEVLYVKNNENDLFSLIFNFEIGSAHSKILPLAFELIEYLPSKGYTPDSWSTAMYQHAGSYTFAVNDIHSTIGISGRQDKMIEILKLIENLIATCSEDATAFENLKSRILKNREDSKSNKNYLMSLQRMYATYGPLNPMTNVLTSEEIKNLDQKTLIQFLREIFTLPHSITYYGKESLENVIQILDTHHNSSMNKKSFGEPVKYNFLHDQSKIYYTDFEMVQAEINWMRNCGLYQNQLSPSVSVFNQYFGGSMSALVFQTIRESKALAYTARATFNTPSTSDGEYTMQAYIGTQADKLPEALDAMNELLNDLPYTENSFVQAKSALKNSIESERVKGLGIISFYRSQKRRGLDYDTRKDIYDNIEKIDFDKIKELHTKFIANQKYSYTLLGSKSKIDFEALKKLNCELVELTVDQLLGEK